tara:strand:- start:321 stop:542 length:222 start_codon:yes stop_codon:yes gene_type:complete
LGLSGTTKSLGEANDSLPTENISQRNRTLHDRKCTLLAGENRGLTISFLLADLSFLAKEKQRYTGEKEKKVSE